ncbi:methyltransferase domain-containing protein [Pseudobacteriovorax antillogorgiicola]|uniref:Arsenite methyltransferase n=1 Tax=Pseudobacteriovorax antillogorgiicola TaxID=1513793 RepID=A0A1Y6CQH1_9BACT|nr:methyltransferase domain-containing protein [Pseudobacteriovorax antillogorgiicola]TCS42236.1 methyltransferase family protein [Pseudobacteriovorax antillogorgiicola]SMF82544.1 Methyltransferase domain-containing protein [Pseudobacteriovorax antillogorgiicola]
MTQSSGLNVDRAVVDRYSGAAKAQEAALCCPVEYNAEYLKVIPQEVIDRDYGCGDPSAYVKAGETVLDLGSGGGKICFIASQVVGEAGRVIGVDMNDDMLELARSTAPQVAEKIGYQNIDFKKGKIQDLKLDRGQVESYLKENPIKDGAGLAELEAFMEDQRQKNPMIKNDSIDVVVSNCVLNLVATEEKGKLFSEIFRVLKRGGRAVISDIVSDEYVPQAMQDDPTLWSGCISGAFQEAEFLKAFEAAGFYGVEILKRDEQPWQTVEGIEFRSMTVVAYKGKEGDCWDHHEALVYKGPFSSVRDDDGHEFVRGERVAVCRKTFEIFSKAPYKDYFEAIKPLNEVPASDAKPFPCTGGVLKRDPKETKGQDYKANIEASAGCC